MALLEGWALVSAACVLGLLIGSFLNVVIHRLPRMLERQWAAECAEAHGNAEVANVVPYNLMRPASTCPHCDHGIRWFENVPVLSYVWLKGRCSQCQTPIGMRYPLVELLTGVVFAVIAWRWGASPQTWALCGYAAALIALTFIDWDTTLLPDDITLPLVWAGLLAAAMQWTPVQLNDAFWGAAVGYLSLWSIYWVFKLLTGKEGMGYGDFKLLAAIGAWLGWQALLPVILVASIGGTVVGLIMKARSELRDGAYVPFGPFLAVGGLILAIAPQLSDWMF